jgi:hypothetical protein
MQMMMPRFMYEVSNWQPENGRFDRLRMNKASLNSGDGLTQAGERHAYVHTLSLRLTADQYRRLRRFVTGHEERTNERITHQAVLQAALGDYLGRQST